MYKEEKVIRRTATASEKKAIIDFLDSINAGPIAVAQAESIEVEENENDYKDGIIDILNAFNGFCGTCSENQQDCADCPIYNCTRLHTLNDLIDYVKKSL